MDIYYKMYPGDRGRFILNFSSAIFLFFFLPLVFLGDRFLGNTRARRPFLALAGLIFYAFGQLAGLAVLLLNSAVTWLAGRSIARGGHRAAAAGAIVFDLALLGAFKYLDFFTGSLNAAFGLALPSAGLVLPIGISFFTFKSISYLADTARAPERGSAGFLDVLLYLSWFPEVTSGPITRFSQFAEGLPARRVTSEQTARGLRRLTVGLAKKLLIAGPVAAIADAAFGAAAPDFRLAWLGAAAYTIQIYFDFSGYSDMAVGLSALFGFSSAENFDYPYLAASITEFWRRWHLSLSGWFRDYVYIPLGGSRRGRARTACNKAVVFLLCGLWHGASWTFVLWGVWHGAFSALESAGVIPVKRLQGSPVGRAVSHGYALLAVGLGFVLFRADSLAAAASVYRGLVSFSVSPATSLALARISPAAWLALALGVIGSLPVAPAARKWAASRTARTANGLCALSYAGTLALFALCLLALAGGGFQPFIYFQF